MAGWAAAAEPPPRARPGGFPTPARTAQAPDWGRRRGGDGPSPLRRARLRVGLVALELPPEGVEADPELPGRPGAIAVVTFQGGQDRALLHVFQRAGFS